LKEYREIKEQDDFVEIKIKETKPIIPIVDRLES